MAIRKKGHSRIEVEGRRFLWHVDRDTHVRIASEDRRFIVAYRWVGEPELSIIGPEFPREPAALSRPLIVHPPAFTYHSPGKLALEVIRWALAPGQVSPSPSRTNVVEPRRVET